MSKKYRVVVTDDYRFSRTFFEMMVQSSTRYVLAASFAGAQNTVDYCMNNAVDLVIMDVMMRTGIDGLTAAQQIKEKRPDVKIILVTSAAEEEWKNKAQEIGVESFWYKEYSEESLLDVMDRTMDGKITVIDATTIQRVQSSISVPAYNEKAADADQDNKVTVTDAIAVQRYLASIPTNEKIGKMHG